MQPRLILNVTDLADALAAQDYDRVAATFALTRTAAIPVPVHQSPGSANHAKMVEMERLRCRQAGLVTLTEYQNRLRIVRFHGVDILGRPDLLCFNGATALVIDCKTGAQRCSHIFQVMLYMYLLPMAKPQYSLYRIAGQLVYQGYRMEVSSQLIDTVFVTNLEQLVQCFTGPSPGGSCGG